MPSWTNILALSWKLPSAALKGIHHVPMCRRKIGPSATVTGWWVRLLDVKILLKFRVQIGTFRSQFKGWETMWCWSLSWSSLRLSWDYENNGYLVSFVLHIYNWKWNFESWIWVFISWFQIDTSEYGYTVSWYTENILPGYYEKCYLERQLIAAYPGPNLSFSCVKHFEVTLLGQTKRFLRGCENFLPALA